MLQIGGGLDLGQEPLGTDHGRELGAQHLDGDLTVVLDVVGEIDGGHAARAELALDPVAVGEGGCEARGGVSHRWPPVDQSRLRSGPRPSTPGRAGPARTPEPPP